MPQCQKTIQVNKIDFFNNSKFNLIAGPCALEGREHAFDMCGKLLEITNKLGINLIYKSSFDKANRTSLSSSRGIGLDKAMSIFSDLRNELNVTIISDVHESEQCKIISEVLDIIQIPAFLCRQTDLLVSAAKTNKTVMVKKGQFLAPWDMSHVIKKLENSGCFKILLCERGASFGYNTLVSDMRSIPIMKDMGYPVIYDATHSVQQPGGNGEVSGGQRQFVPILSKAATAIGIAGLFIETHENPDSAPSDGPNMLNIKDLEGLLAKLIEIDNVVKNK